MMTGELCQDVSEISFWATSVWQELLLTQLIPMKGVEKQPPMDAPAFKRHVGQDCLVR